MKPKTNLKSALLLIVLAISNYSYTQTTLEQPLWPQGIENNPIKYPEEKVRTSDVLGSSLSQMNRVFSCVSTPTYVLYKPVKANGVGIIICPGGGFRDVWFDREGADFALFLAKYGITSMVLKYRTYNSGYESLTLEYMEYVFHVYADAKQAIFMLRSQAKELGLDTAKIGIGGFSAGGSLAIGTALRVGDSKLPSYAINLKENAHPDFTCLVYPGIYPDFINAVDNATNIPPIFIVNGGEDNVTPAKNCIELYTELQKKNVKTELHIYAKGGHGFDSGIGRGAGISAWRESFIAWLKDLGLMQ